MAIFSGSAIFGEFSRDFANPADRISYNSPVKLRRILRLAAWTLLVILIIGNVAALSQPDTGDVYHLMRVQIGQHEYILEEYRDSLFATRALAGGGFSIA